MKGWLNSGRSPSTVSAFGKFAAERYVVSMTSFKRILRMNHFSLEL